MPKPENPKRALACPHSRLVREGERGRERERERASEKVLSRVWEDLEGGTTVAEREGERERGGRERRREPRAGYRS